MTAGIVIGLVILVGLLVLAGWRVIFRGPEAYHEAYRKACQDDIDYYNSHPGCSLAEAHQHRDAVNRRYGRG